MKLPQPVIEGISRNRRTDSLGSVGAYGVEPAFLGSWISKIPVIGGPLSGAACAACDLIPNPALKAACLAACQ